ncbi:ATP-citrate synthase alpha chain protein 3 [Orobanche minor]
MLFGKRGKSGLAALKLDLAQVAEFVKDRSVEPFIPHDQ